LNFGSVNYVSGRAEVVDKDELAISNGVYRVRALTIGYSRDIVKTGFVAGAVGANVTAYSMPSGIKPYYGSNPHSFYVFLRVRGHGEGMHDMHSMNK
jgi:hypothetical protein